jgi:hypothetical protein
MAPLIRTIIVTLALGGLVMLGYWQLMFDQQAKAIKELEALNAQMQARLAERQAMIERLSRSRRIAHIQITDQKNDTSGKIAETSLLFIELDDRGAELGRQKFTIPGDVLFVDAWTVKFDPERVAEGHPMMGRTLVLLRRIFSDQLAPKDGLLIDTPGAIPPGYAASTVGEFEKRVWKDFWNLATDSEAAKRIGVRVAQGEAVYKPVRAGQTFELIADAVGGISLMPLAKDDDEALTRAGG